MKKKNIISPVVPHSPHPLHSNGRSILIQWIYNSLLAMNENERGNARSTSSHMSSPSTFLARYSRTPNCCLDGCQKTAQLSWTLNWISLSRAKLIQSKDALWGTWLLLDPTSQTESRVDLFLLVRSHFSQSGFVIRNRALLGRDYKK